MVDIIQYRMSSLHNSFFNIKSTKNVIIVQDKSELAGFIDSTKTYLIDGVIDMETIEITVPENGMTVSGLGISISKLVSSADNYTMFRTSGTSGDLFISDVTCEASGVSSKLFDLNNNGQGKGIQIQRTNFENTTEIGSFNSYRQFLAFDVGMFNVNDGIEFIGQWTGARISTSIVRDFGATGTVFKAGAGLTFNGRFLTDINMEIPSGAVGLDFFPSNFINDGELEIMNGKKVGDGVFTPNFSSGNPKCRVRTTAGVKSTYPGGEWTIGTAVSTLLPIANTLVKLAGVTVYSDLQWFSQTTDNAFVSDSTKDVELQIQGSLSFTGIVNNVVGLQIRHWDDSASMYIDVGSRFTSTLNAAGRTENVTFIGRTTINENDRIEIWVENKSTPNNITAELGGFVGVNERTSI